MELISTLLVSVCVNLSDLLVPHENSQWRCSNS